MITLFILREDGGDFGRTIVIDGPFKTVFDVKEAIFDATGLPVGQ